MNQPTKIIAAMALSIGALVGITVGIASLLPDAPPIIIPTVTEVDFSDSTTFPFKTTKLDEGYSLDIVDGWELVGHTPDRSVDRYRFERKADSGTSILTVSIYKTSQTADFDALIAARYGSALLNSQDDVMIGTLPAKRITAEFLDMGNTADVLVKADATTFVSLYGIHQPLITGDLTVAKEINFMQKSFRSK